MRIWQKASLSPRLLFMTSLREAGRTSWGFVKGKNALVGFVEVDDGGVGIIPERAAKGAGGEDGEAVLDVGHFPPGGGAVDDGGAGDGDFVGVGLEGAVGDEEIHGGKGVIGRDVKAEVEVQLEHADAMVEVVNVVGARRKDEGEQDGGLLGGYGSVGALGKIDLQQVIRNQDEEEAKNEEEAQEEEQQPAWRRLRFGRNTVVCRDLWGGFTLWGCGRWKSQWAPGKKCGRVGRNEQAVAVACR